jgi:transglutaminase-like putative cysteine protease
VLNYIQSNIRYAEDTGDVSEYWQLPSETLARGTGDCEDVAFLFASLMAAQRYPVRVIVGTLDGVGHAWPEIKINGNWVPIEPLAVQNVSYIFKNPEKYRKEVYVENIFGQYKIHGIIACEGYRKGVYVENISGLYQLKYYDIW